MMCESGTERQREAGASMVEFAIVGLVFFIIVFGVFDFGRAILYYNMLSNAAREGARYGAIWSRDGALITNTEICNVAFNSTTMPGITYPASPGCGNPVGTPPYTLTVSVPSRGAQRTETSDGSPVKVTATFGFQPLTPLIGGLVGDPVMLSASSSMYVED